MAIPGSSALFCVFVATAKRWDDGVDVAMDGGHGRCLVFALMKLDVQASLTNRRREAGFTLIELLVVVAIVAILAAVAIPQFATYKRKAHDAEMTSALNSARTAMEAFYESNDYTYAGATLAGLILKGYRVGNADLEIVSAGSTDYVLRACLDGGTSNSFTFDTALGSNTPTAATCT